MEKLVTTSVGAGPDLVLLHGWGMSKGVWEALLPVLSPRFHVTIVDLPGYGANVGCEAEAFEDVCSRVGEVLPDDAIVLGWSLGGMVALHVAAQNPERVRRVVMVASSPRFSRAEDWQSAMPLDVLDRFAEGVIDDSAATIRRFVALQFLGTKVERRRVRDLQDAVTGQSFAPGVLGRGLGYLRDVDLRGEFASLPVPLSVVLGGKDRLVPSSVAQSLRSLNPNAEICLMPEAGHAPFISHPEEFAEQIAI